jgi:leucyl-tRNA synthetase
MAKPSENSVYGSSLGPANITPEQMTDEIWDYVLCDGPFPDPSPVSREQVDQLKHEYNYFYPFDLRSSGKDLIPNHMTFSIYTHVALFSEDKWPLSMRVNGHLMLNGKKMSKSTGNSLTMRESIEKFGADATRLCLADAGDGVEDANFDEKTANANILRVHTLLAWCEVRILVICIRAFGLYTSQEMIKEEPNMRQGPRDSYHDRAFEDEINELINITQTHYEAYAWSLIL